MEQSLFIARHAHASEAAIDSGRPLSAKGEKQIDRICKALRSKGLISPELIWHSHYRRAVETAKLLQSGLGLSVPLKTVQGLTTFDDPMAIVPLINQSRENLMIVGHEPNLSGLANILVTGTQTLDCIAFPKASILCLSRLNIGAEATSWKIEWHISHKIFK